MCEPGSPTAAAAHRRGQGGVPAADRATAEAQLADDIERHIPRLQQEGLIDQPLDLRSHLQLMNVHYGAVADIVEGLRDDTGVFPFADYLIAVVQAESSTQAQVLERLRVLANDIAPALGWRPVRAQGGPAR